MNETVRGRGRPVGSFANPVRKASSEYRAWSAMKQRCQNPKCGHFKWYGARGVSVCEQWSGKRGFAQFYADMGPCNGLTLDRKDNAGNYNPGNCRWATMKEQTANRRPGGPDLNPESLRGKARAAGLPYHVVYQRIKANEWSEAEALSTPVLPRGRRPAS